MAHVKPVRVRYHQPTAVQGHVTPRRTVPISEPPVERNDSAKVAWQGLVAWVVILAVAVYTITGHQPPEEPSEGDDLQDTVGLILVELQGKYLIGATRMMPLSGPSMFDQSERMLNVGTLGQRQRFIVLAAELAGPATARTQLEQLDRLIVAPAAGEPLRLDPDQATVQRVLHDLYPAGLDELDLEDARALAGQAAISELDREVVVDRLGWFGRLAVSGLSGQDTHVHDSLMASATAVAIVMVGVAVAGAGALAIGFAGLVVAVVMIFLGRLTSGLGATRGRHCIYAETFAVWFVLFVGLQELVALVPDTGLHMGLVVLAFPLSLLALAWPVARGICWGDVRRDIGLTLGARPALEPLIGLGGYLVTLPILGAGLVITFLLMAMQGLLSGEVDTFAPAGGPAHPIIVYMSGPDIGPKLLVLALAAVAAPLVEETMFRGVLYRHLRGATGPLGTLLSVIVSTLINTVLFAAIHPQGWVTVPALMGLACGMTLFREWRGTLIPSMVIHGVSNALVMVMLWTMLAV